MKFRIEANGAEKNSFLAKVGNQIKGCESLDDVAVSLAFESSPYADCIIYRGGSHVAILDKKNMSRRLGMVTEK